MKYTLLLIVVFNSFHAFGQYIYKRNMYGNMEVYETFNGTDVPRGQPIASIERNLYGDFVLKTNEQNAKTNLSDPYSRKPNYESYRSTPYQRPILTDLNILNVVVPPISNNVIRNKTSYDTRFSDAKNLFEEDALRYNEQVQSFKNLFKKIIDKPKKIRDGWHEVISFSDPTVLNNVLRRLGKSTKADYELNSGYCFVQSNKVVNMVVKDKDGCEETRNLLNYEIKLSSQISNCLAVISTKDYFHDMPHEVYFVNSMIDSNEVISNPCPNGFTFTTKNIFKNLMILISNNPISNSGLEGNASPCERIFILQATNNNLQIFLEPGQYYFYAQEYDDGASNKRWKGSFSVLVNQMSGTQLVSEN